MNTADELEPGRQKPDKQIFQEVLSGQGNLDLPPPRPFPISDQAQPMVNFLSFGDVEWLWTYIIGVETHAITLMRFSEMISFRTYFLLESLVILGLCVCVCVCVCAFSWLCYGACGILVACPGIKPAPPAA